MNIITSFNTGIISGKRLYSFLIKSLLLFTLLVTFLSCKVQTINLEPQLPNPQEINKLNVSIGYYHSPEFLAFKDSIYHVFTRIDENVTYKEKVTYKTENNKTSYKIEDIPVITYNETSRRWVSAIFPLGSSSDALFKSIYPQVFNSTLPVNQTFSSPATGIDFILKPEIVSFHYIKSYMDNPRWAEIIYLFTLYSPDGKVLASWTTVGWGEYDKANYKQNTVSKAMENAAHKFIRSFDHVPEVKRCLNGLSPEGVTVTPEMQDTIMSLQYGDSTFTNGYKGLVSARIKHEFVHNVPLKNQFGVKDTIGVAAFEIFLRNEGNNRLYIDPLNISWRPLGHEEIYPISSHALNDYHVETIDPIPDATQDDPLDGYALLFDIVTGLLFSYKDPIQEKEFLLRQKYFKREALQESTFNSNTSVTGSVYFPVLSNVPVSGVLEIPVIDLDTATRYIIRFQLPVYTKTKEIKFTNQTQPAENKGLGTF